MSRLIVVSNRVNAPLKPGEAPAGGLAVALAAALREYSGFWFGWSGETVPAFTGELQTRRIEDVTIVTVDLEESDYQEYYNGYANGTLWPLFHYRIDLTAYDRSFGQGYDRVNQRFAETLAPLIQPDDLIWVHDYHLIPLGRELRKLGVTNPIGFFLHIPWPAAQLIATLPRNRQLVESMFSYDLVGFQTEDWLWAFESYVLGDGGGTWAEDGRLSAFGKTLRAGVFPIGLDVEDFQALSQSPLAARAYRPHRRQQHLPDPDRGRRPAGLFEGIGRAAARLRALPGRSPRNEPGGALPADRSDIPGGGRRLSGSAGANRRPVRPDQRRLCRHGLGADPLRQPQLPPRRAGRHLSRREGRTRHAAARRHEPGRQGVCRRPGSGGPRRPGAVALRGRGAADAAGGHRQSLQPRGDVRGAEAGDRNAPRGTDRPLGALDGRRTKFGRPGLARLLRECASRIA